MEKLIAWAKSEPNRHFVMRLASNNNETRWRVAVWFKAEGESYGLSGHGSSMDLEAAIEQAIRNWETAEPDHHRPRSAWYCPRVWEMTKEMATGEWHDLPPAVETP